MALTREQMRDIRALSDTKLYREVVEFLDTEVLVKREMQKRIPLPNTQMNGLLSIAQVSTYGDVLRFVAHQRSRNWQGDKAHIRDFYKDLELILKNLPGRAKTEELVTSGLKTEQANKELHELGALLVCEFIQHLAAENLVRERERIDQEKREREQRRAGHD